MPLLRHYNEHDAREYEYASLQLYKLGDCFPVHASAQGPLDVGRQVGIRPLHHIVQARCRRHDLHLGNFD